MPRSTDLEIYRERFLNSLDQSKPELEGQQDFMLYWRTVETEAAETEELAKLDTWVSELARDRDKIRALKERMEMVDDAKGSAQAVVQLLVQILMLLDDIERKLKKRLHQRRAVLGFLLFRAGPGVKKKMPPPGKGDDKKGEDKKASETVLAKPKPKVKKPTKKMQR